MAWVVELFVHLLVVSSALCQACYLPQSIDFEDCLYPAVKAASSGYDWTAQNAAGYTTWQRTQGLTLNPQQRDHTTQEHQGNTISITRPTSQTATGNVQRDIVSPMYTKPDSATCTMHYWLLVSGAASSDVLEVHINSTDKTGVTTSELLAKQNTRDSTWTQLSVSVKQLETFQIIFRASLKLDHPSTTRGGFIAIDDISFATDCCQNCHFAPRLDLECGLQGYSLSTQQSSLNWMLFSGPSITGPSNDHTFNSIRGNYLLVDAVTSANKRAIFQSPEYKRTGVPGSCNLSFAYHVTGAGVGNLSVIVQEQARGNERVIWAARGPQGQQWMKAVVSFDSSVNYKLLFVASIDSNQRAQVGLDDIVMSDGCCTGATLSGDPFGICSGIGYDTRVNRPRRDRPAHTFVDESLRFDCNGTVLSWRLRTTASCNYTMQVWRLMSQANREYKRVSTETIELPGFGEHTVASKADVQFLAGDFIGWQHVSGNGRIMGSSAQRGGVIAVETSSIISSLINNQPAFRFPDVDTRPLRYSVAANIHGEGAAHVTIVILQPNATTSSVYIPPGPADGQPSSATGLVTGPTPAVGSTAAMNSEPFYPWVIMGLVLLGIIITMTIVLVYYVKTHWNSQKITQSPHRKHHLGRNNLAASNGQVANSPSFKSAMKLPVISGSPIHQPSNSGDHFGKVSLYPSTPAMLDLSRPTLACETRLPSPGFTAVPTPSVVKAFPGMSINQPSSAFGSVPEYTEPSPQLGNCNDLNDTQATSLAASLCNETLPSSQESGQAALVTDGLAKEDDGEQSDARSSSLNETPSKKSEITTYTNDSRPRSHSDVFMRSCSNNSRPHSRSDVFSRSIDSPFRGSFHRRTPYSDPVDMMGKKSIPRYSSPYQEPAVTVPGIFAQLKSGTYKCLQRDKIDVQAMIAHGQYCAVYAGVWKKGSADVPVAVKTVYPKKEGDYIPFLREAAIMGQFSHRNIVQLFGVVMDNSGKAPQLILELMSDNLKTYLESLRPAGGHLPEVAAEHLGEHLLNMCRDVASGMNYLEAKGFVHRDLAARNVMIGSDRVCKIGDFSLCRDMTTPDSLASSRGIKIPTKWAAPEVLKHHKFSGFSDVWSYGVLLFEIWSLGMDPFENITDDEVLERLENGNRLSPPSKCPLAIYELMMDCWHPYSMERPCFTQIVQIMEMTDRNILLGQITPPEAETIVYEEAEDIKDDEHEGPKRTPFEHLHHRYANFGRGEISPKYLMPDEKRMTPFARQTSAKLTSLPRHMLAEQMSNYSHSSIETGSSSVTSV